MKNATVIDSHITTHAELVQATLDAYGHAGLCALEARKTHEVWGGTEYGLRLELASRDWIHRARKLRRQCAMETNPHA